MQAQNNVGVLISSKGEEWSQVARILIPGKAPPPFLSYLRPCKWRLSLRAGLVFGSPTQYSACYKVTARPPAGSFISREYSVGEPTRWAREFPPTLLQLQSSLPHPYIEQRGPRISDMHYCTERIATRFVASVITTGLGLED